MKSTYKFIIIMLLFFGANNLFAQVSLLSTGVAAYTTASEGDFYLTSDTNEMYVGMQDGTLRKISSPNEITTITDNSNGTFTYKNELNQTTTINFGASSNNWSLLGNTGTNSTTNFLGTTDAQDLVLRAGNVEKLRLNGAKGQVLVNRATVFNNHPLVIRANGVDVLAFEDNTGVPKWHWNLLANGLNFVESNVLDYRLFLENGGNVGVNTGNPTERLHINGGMRLVGTFKDSNNQAGTAGQILSSTGTGTDWITAVSSGGNNWSLTGNSIANTNFIGTTNYQPFNIKVNNNNFGSFHPLGGISLGRNAVANNNQSIAIGDGASANSNEAIAIGDNAKANSYRSIAIGINSEASNNQAIAIGNSAKASNQQSVAIGRDTNVSGRNATGIGYQATTSQANAIVLGSSSNNNNKVGIGTNTPDERLHIVGSIKIVDNTEGAGKILTSDAFGKATWTSPSAATNTAYGQAFKASNSLLNQFSAIPLGTAGEVENLTINNNNIQTQTLTGVYRITYTVSVEATANGNREPEFYLTLNNSEIPNTRSYVFLRGNNNGQKLATVTRTILVNIPNTYRQISIRSSISDNNVSILANGTSLLVEFVR